MSFTYDHTAEGIFFNELMGMRKQRESVWRVFKGVVQSLGSGRCGAVRINFGTPVLLTVCFSSFICFVFDVFEEGSVKALALEA